MATAVSRRQFLKIGAGGLLGLYVGSLYRGFGSTPVAYAQIPGGTLDPARACRSIVTPLLIPPVMPKADTLYRPRFGNIDYYEISMKQFAEQILPAGLPAHDGVGLRRREIGEQEGRCSCTTRPRSPSRPQADRPVRIKWINDLRDASGNYLPHLLPVDPTLHWANPPGGAAGRDTRPTFASTPDRYTGPVPMVTHVHGAVGVGDESDGYAEAWYLPAAKQHPRRLRERRARGTTSSQEGPPQGTGSCSGAPASPPSSTRTTTAPRRSGTTTTRWA